MQGYTNTGSQAARTNKLFYGIAKYLRVPSVEPASCHPPGA